MALCRGALIAYQAPALPKTLVLQEHGGCQAITYCRLSAQKSGVHDFFQPSRTSYSREWRHVSTLSRSAGGDNVSWKAAVETKCLRDAGRDHRIRRRIVASASEDVEAISSEAAQKALSPEPSDSVGQRGLLHFAVRGLLRFAADQFLPLALVLGVLLGSRWPGPGQIAHRWGLSRYTTFGIFFISGLTVKGGDVHKAVEAWPALLYGLVAILALTPLAALVALKLPLWPPELAAGLAVFCCVPTTLSSGVSLTQAVGANTALALGLTALSNLLGIVTMPFLLSGLVGSSAGLSLPAGPLLESLLRTLLLPLLLGAAVRNIVPGVATAVDGHRKLLSMLSSAQLSLVPWMQVSASQMALAQVAPLQLLAAALAGLVLHTAFVLGNTAAVKILPLGIKRSNGAKGANDEVERAVIIVASQKTLPVAVAVVERLGGALGAPGLLLLPCIATHLTQILMDSVLVGHWLESDQKRLRAELSAQQSA